MLTYIGMTCFVLCMMAQTKYLQSLKTLNVSDIFNVGGEKNTLKVTTVKRTMKN